MEVGTTVIYVNVKMIDGHFMLCTPLLNDEFLILNRAGLILICYGQKVITINKKILMYYAPLFNVQNRKISDVLLPEQHVPSDKIAKVIFRKISNKEVFIVFQRSAIRSL